MISSIAIFFVVSCILMSINPLNLVKSEFLGEPINSTSPTSTWDSDFHKSETNRTKRSPTVSTPYHLKIRVKHAAKLDIKLNWYVKAHQSVANEHLPVILPFVDSDLQVMMKIGEFVLYQDTHECSAVVYFRNLNALYGVIGSDYYVVSLPFNFNENGEYQSGVVEEPYIQQRDYVSPHIFPNVLPPSPSDTNAWEDYIRNPEPSPDLGQKRQGQCDYGPDAKISRIDENDDDFLEQKLARARQQVIELVSRKESATKSQEYYLETLVFITRDLVELFEQRYGTDDYIEWIVRYHIVYFNAVDTIFQKIQLSKIGFHINIAKIVIEDSLSPFDFISDDEIQFNEVISKFPKFMNLYAEAYPIDSFDHVFISTSRDIYDDEFQVNGITKHGDDLYAARKRNEFYNVVPISIVTFQNAYADYLVGVHQIAQTLNLKIDPHEYGLTSAGQCYGIMQREGAKCSRCMKWSDKSRNEFKLFFTKNKNRCVQSNSPRSMQPPGVRRFLTTTHQCQCLGYQSTVSPRDVGVDGCMMPLKCESQSQNGQWFREYTVRPFDGTPCTTKKVCWNGKCVPLNAS